MKVGQAYNSVTKALLDTESAVVVEFDKSSGDTDYIGHTYTIESLYELHKETTTGTKLGAKIQEVGLNIGVNTSHKGSVDQNRVYFLSQVKYADYANIQKPSSTPVLSDTAKQILGMHPAPSDALVQAQQAYDTAVANLQTAQAALHQKQLAFDAAQQALTTPQSTLTQKQLALQTAQATLAEKQQAVNTAQTAYDADQTDANQQALNVAKAAQQEAQGKVDQAQAAQQAAQNAVEPLEAALNAAQAEFTQAKTEKDTRQTEHDSAQTALRGAITVSPAQRVTGVKYQYDKLLTKLNTTNTSLATAKTGLATVEAGLVTAKAAATVADNDVKAKKAILHTMGQDDTEAKREYSKAVGEKTTADSKVAELTVKVTAAKELSTKADTAAKAAKSAHDAKLVELKAAEKVLAATVDDARLSEFYKHFGSKYVTKVEVGREFLALSHMSRQGFAKSSAVGVDVGVNVPNVVEIKQTVNREKDEKSRQFDFRSTIKARGIQDQIPTSAKSFADLEAAIQEYYKSSQKEAPADLNFETANYDLAFRTAGISEATVLRFNQKVKRAEVAILQILDLRAKAVKALLTEKFHKATTKKLASGANVPIAISKNEHNRRLEYLYKELRGIIGFLNNQVEKIEANVFADGFIDALKAKTRKGGEIEARINTIVEDLKTRANKGLIYVKQHNIQHTRTRGKFSKYQFKDGIKLGLPAGTASVYFAAYDGDVKTLADPIADHGDDWRAADVDDAWQAPTVGAANVDADAVLAWPDANRNFKFTLKRDRFGKDKKLYQANGDGHREYVISPGFDSTDEYYLYKKKGAFTNADGAPATAPYGCTIQVYAARPQHDLDLDLSDANQGVESLLDAELVKQAPKLATKTEWQFLPRRVEVPAQKATQQAAPANA